MTQENNIVERVLKEVVIERLKGANYDDPEKVIAKCMELWFTPQERELMRLAVASAREDAENKQLTNCPIHGRYMGLCLSCLEEQKASRSAKSGLQGINNSFSNLGMRGKDERAKIPYGLSLAVCEACEKELHNISRIVEVR
jgi:hypothetical protein